LPVRSIRFRRADADEATRRLIGNQGLPPGPNHGQAFFLQHPERAVRRGDGHVELFAHVPHGRHFVARSQRAVSDQLPVVASDLCVPRLLRLGSLIFTFFLR
jgi:hypothetical protein